MRYLNDKEVVVQSVELNPTQQVIVTSLSIMTMLVVLACLHVVDVSVASSATRATLSWGLRETTGVSLEQLSDTYQKSIGI